MLVSLSHAALHAACLRYTLHTPGVLSIPLFAHYSPSLTTSECDRAMTCDHLLPRHTCLALTSSRTCSKQHQQASNRLATPASKRPPWNPPLHHSTHSYNQRVSHPIFTPHLTRHQKLTTNLSSGRPTRQPTPCPQRCPGDLPRYRRRRFRSPHLLRHLPPLHDHPPAFFGR